MVCSCGEDFDTTLNYDGLPRTCGPVRRYCTLQCAKREQNVKNRYARRAQLQREYGITLEQYEEMHVAQEGKCAICGQPETTVAKDGRKWTLAVDHDHVTGEVRGLLCTPCNRGLGFLRDSTDVLRKAIKYLENS